MEADYAAAERSKNQFAKDWRKTYDSYKGKDIDGNPPPRKTYQESIKTSRQVLAKFRTEEEQAKDEYRKRQAAKASNGKRKGKAAVEADYARAEGSKRQAPKDWREGYDWYDGKDSDDDGRKEPSLRNKVIDGEEDYPRCPICLGRLGRLDDQHYLRCKYAHEEMNRERQVQREHAERDKR